MAATLIAVVVALALGHLMPELAVAIRQHGWYDNWLRWLNAQFPEGSFCGPVARRRSAAAGA
jgi:AmpE protein